MSYDDGGPLATHLLKKRQVEVLDKHSNVEGAQEMGVTGKKKRSGRRMFQVTDNMPV